MGVRTDRGFTLIELLVVLAILVGVYALSGPLFDNGTSVLDAKAAARQLAAGLRKARATAIAGSQSATLLIDLDQRTFVVSGDAKSYSLPSSVELALFTATEEKVASNRGSIRFFSDGSSTGGRITVRSGSREQTLDVDWLTGRVVIL